MKYSLITIAFLAFYLAGCKSNRCDPNIKDWISDAPTVLEEFLLVKDEILSNKSFIDSFSSQGLLFVSGASAGPDQFAGFDMPKLKAWFRQGRSYIAFSESDTSACFKKCDNGSHSASGEIKLGPFDRKNYKTNVNIVDSLKLRGNWNAEVRECNGCGS